MVPFKLAKLARVGPNVACIRNCASKAGDLVVVVVDEVVVVVVVVTVVVAVAVVVGPVPVVTDTVVVNGRVVDASCC